MPLQKNSENLVDEWTSISPLKLHIEDELHDPAGIQRVGNLTKRWRSQQGDWCVELRMIRHVQRLGAERDGLRPVSELKISCERNVEICRTVLAECVAADVSPPF